MKDLLEFIAKNIVDKPEEVYATQTETERGTLLELKVAPEDMGKIIGKQGRIAKAVRAVIKAAAIHSNKKVIIEIIQ
ncbi:UPF0109 protein [Clostridia bacterium]|nr:UPF0109 protein [Clostridia bacterium]